MSDRYNLDPISLGKLRGESFRLLRNLIYAKRGHIFKSEDLTAYFSQFPWYKPTRTVSDQELSTVDKQNIEIIQAFEGMDEKKPTIVWGLEKEGVWQNGYGMAAGWDDRFVIYADNRMEFLFSQMGQLDLIARLVGTYAIRGNVLIFSVEEVDIYEHSCRFEYSGAFGYQWEDPKKNTVYFKNPLIYKFPISPILVGKKDWLPEGLSIEIGGYDFFRMASDVSDKY